MITTDTEFLEAVEQKKFIDDPEIQEQMFWHAFKPVSIRNLTVLWLVQQSYTVSFSHLPLESTYLEHATVDELLKALTLFKFKPTAFVERVFNKGSSAQIEKLNTILKELINE